MRRGRTHLFALSLLSVVKEVLAKAAADEGELESKPLEGRTSESEFAMTLHRGKGNEWHKAYESDQWHLGRLQFAFYCGDKDHKQVFVNLTQT